MATIGIGSNPLNPLARTKVPKQEKLVEVDTPSPSQNNIPQPLNSPTRPHVEEQAPKSHTTLSLNELLDALSEHGYVAKAKPKYVKHTFDLKEATYKRFSEMCPSLGRKVKEAVTEAFDDWCDKYQKQYETIQQAKKEP
jgi:hypothetical protein